MAAIAHEDEPVTMSQISGWKLGSNGGRQIYTVWSAKDALMAVRVGMVTVEGSRERVGRAQIEQRKEAVEEKVADWLAAGTGARVDRHGWLLRGDWEADDVGRCGAAGLCGLAA